MQSVLVGQVCIGNSRTPGGSFRVFLTSRYCYYYSVTREMRVSRGKISAGKYEKLTHRIYQNPRDIEIHFDALLLGRRVSRE